MKIRLQKIGVSRHYEVLGLCEGSRFSGLTLFTWHPYQTLRKAAGLDNRGENRVLYKVEEQRIGSSG